MGAPEFSSHLFKTGQYKGKEGNTPAEFKTMIPVSRLQRDGAYEAYFSGWVGLFSTKRFRRLIKFLWLLRLYGCGYFFSSITFTNRTLVDGLVVANFRVKRNGVVVVTANANNNTAIPASARPCYSGNCLIVF
jgi:hypothetical protein